MISSSFFGLQENTAVKLQSVLQDLCGEDCKLEIFQEDRSDEIIVSGNYVEGEQKYKRSTVDSIAITICVKNVFHQLKLVALLSSPKPKY